MRFFHESAMEAGIARAYRQDLRDHVSDAALAGLSARGAAERFAAILWVRRARQTGERKQGQPRRSKLDPHRESPSPKKRVSQPHPHIGD